MMFRAIPDSLLHFADPTFPGLSGRDLIGRREHDEDWGLPEPSTIQKGHAARCPMPVGQVIPLAPARRPGG